MKKHITWGELKEKLNSYCFDIGFVGSMVVISQEYFHFKQILKKSLCQSCLNCHYFKERTEIGRKPQTYNKLNQDEENVVLCKYLN